MTSYFDCRPYELPEAYAEFRGHDIPAAQKKANLLMPPVKLVRATDGSVGLDIHFPKSKPGYLLFPNSNTCRRAIIHTGIYLSKDFPSDMYVNVRMRSSAFLKACFILHAGLIDSDYKGEICLLLGCICFAQNHFVQETVPDIVANPTFVGHEMPDTPFAQLEVLWRAPGTWRDLAPPTTNFRGAGGFGSTDVKQEVDVSDALYTAPEAADLYQIKKRRRQQQSKRLCKAPKESNAIDTTKESASPSDQ